MTRPSSNAFAEMLRRRDALLAQSSALFAEELMNEPAIEGLIAEAGLIDQRILAADPRDPEVFSAQTHLAIRLWDEGCPVMPAAIRTLLTSIAEGLGLTPAAAFERVRTGRVQREGVTGRWRVFREGSRVVFEDHGVST